jgi:hypothetical protein
VVIFSSDADELLALLIAEGAAEAVPKPFDIDKFISMIDRYFPSPGGQPMSSDSPLTASQTAA